MANGSAAAAAGRGASFSDQVYKLCTSDESVSSVLAADPKLAPGDAWKKLYGHHAGRPKSAHAADDAGKGAVSQEALDRAAKCGKWGPTQPSDLFLRVTWQPTAADTQIRIRQS